MIDIRKLKELVRLMVNNDLTELDLRDTEEQVTLRRDRQSADPPVVSVAPAQQAVAAPAAPAAQPAAPTPAADDDTAGLTPIECPMVGTFYSAANPDSPPFVNVGDAVSTDTVVCLVEAMKIFNEIKAEMNGTVAKVCVANGASVEFGQPLFLIKPD